MDTSQAVINSANVVTKVGAVGSVSSVPVNWMVENGQLISLCLGMGGFTVAVAGFVVAWVYNHKRYKLQLKQWKQKR